MGKQVNFFISGEDLRTIFDLVDERNEIILNDIGKTVTISEVLQINASIQILYIASITADIHMGISGRYINSSWSEAIELSVHRPLVTHLTESRIWAQFTNYGLDDKIVTKSPEFSHMYDFYAKWLKKHFRMSIPNCSRHFYYIGEDAYRLYKEEGYQMMAGNYKVDFG